MTNGGSSLTRPDTVPSSSSSVHVSQNSFDFSDVWRYFETTDPEGTVTRWEFNNAGRVIKVTEDEGGLNKETEMSYNADGNLKKLTAKNSDTGDQVTERANYGTADAQNDLLSRVEDLKVGSTTLAGYEYLGLDRRVKISYGEPSVDLTYIGGGTGPANALDRFEYAYDRANNRTSKDNKVASSGHDCKDNTKYRYDGLHRRVKKITTVTRHYYYSDQWQVLEVRIDNEFVAYTQHLWGLRYADDLIRRDRDSSDPRDGTLNERLYVTHDYFSPTALFDRTGSPVYERYEYDAFGTPRVMDANFNARSSSDWDWEVRYGAVSPDLLSSDLESVWPQITSRGKTG